MKSFYITTNTKNEIASLAILIMLPLFVLGLLASCRKFVEIDPPNNRLVTKNVFDNNETANSAMLNIYAQMASGLANPYNMSLYCGYYADELINYNSTTSYRQLYTNNMQPIDARTNTIWSTAYNYIYQANAIFEGSEESTMLSSEVQRQLMAEAAFIRAFWHFYLTNLYGDIPYIKTSDYSVSAISPRLPIAEVYKQITADLEYAKLNLNDNYVASNGITPSTERLRPNRYAAAGLLARVLLFTGDYSGSEREASLIISNTDSFGILALDQVFLKNSKEALWQLANPFPTITYNTNEGRFFILTTKPTASSLETASISPFLLNAFEANDNRLKRWIGLFVDVSVTPNEQYFFPNKYKVKSAGTITEYSMVLRLAEQYLIRSEARLQMANYTGAIDDLDVIRGRAGLELIRATNPLIGRTDLLKAILAERQRELFVEWGARWIDLKRSGDANIVMPVVTPIKGGLWSTDFLLWPIPFNDVQNSPSLPQNKGYN